MGFAANGFCFDTPAAAAAYACGKDYPFVSASVDSGGHPVSVVVECTGSVDNVLTLQRDVNGLVDGTSALALMAPACDVTEWQTFYPFSFSASAGSEVAAAVLGCWLVGWGWRAVFDVLKGRYSSSSDDGE